MRGVTKKVMGWLRTRESGFTLVELLVVVGIIVALAAVIIPNVAQFAGKGEEGAKSAENENVQAAVDALMADKGRTTVVANDLGTSGNANLGWAAFDLDDTAGTFFLDAYLRSPSTTYFYCWDTAGLVTEQFTTAASCTK